MMDFLGNLVNGMAFALGTVIVTTIAIYIGLKRGTKLIKEIVAKVADAWSKVKKEFIIDAKVETKNSKNKKD